jgi:cyclase
MLTKRIIPCLDVKDNRVVKGVHFLNLRDAGDPVELGTRYSDSGADELVFLDITATIRSRKTIVELVEKVAENVFIPFTVGGGIQAVENPGLITEAAKRFGSQCVVVAIDAKRAEKKRNKWKVCVKAGTEPTDIDVIEWAVRAEKLGAGEILLTSMDTDGTKAGYDNQLNRSVTDAVNIPVIASGGAGKLEHLYDAIVDGGVDAVLMASVTHFGNYTITQMKKYLASRGIAVNL